MNVPISKSAGFRADNPAAPRLFDDYNNDNHYQVPMETEKRGLPARLLCRDRDISYFSALICR